MPWGMLSFDVIDFRDSPHFCVAMKTTHHRYYNPIIHVSQLSLVLSHISSKFWVLSMCWEKVFDLLERTSSTYMKKPGRDKFGIRNAQKIASNYNPARWNWLHLSHLIPWTVRLQPKSFGLIWIGYVTSHRKDIYPRKVPFDGEVKTRERKYKKAIARLTWFCSGWTIPIPWLNMSREYSSWTSLHGFP